LRSGLENRQLRHPSIVAVHEVGEADGTPYLVSDFVRGMTLADRLTAGPLPPQEAARLVIEVADALHCAHAQGVIHRDIKPSNIMLDDQGRPFLMDFGLAKREAGEITMTLAGQVHFLISVSVNGPNHSPCIPRHREHPREGSNVRLCQ
jgi:eukaryotic-like serine/threonine-protein kinase